MLRKFTSNVADGSVRVDPESMPGEVISAVIKRLERETGLSCCAGPRSDGHSLDDQGNIEDSRYELALGRSMGRNTQSYTDIRQVRVIIPVAR